MSPCPKAPLLLAGTRVSGLLNKSLCIRRWWWQCWEAVTLQRALHVTTDGAVCLFCSECHSAAAATALLLLSTVWFSFHELCLMKGQADLQADLQADKLHHMQQSCIYLPSYYRSRMLKSACAS